MLTVFAKYFLIDVWQGSECASSPQYARVLNIPEFWTWLRFWICQGSGFIKFLWISLRKERSYSELLWSTFSRIRTEYREIRSISPYSVQMWENADQNNSKYGHFLRCVYLWFWICRGSDYAMVMNITGFRIYQGLEYASSSQYVITKFWIFQVYTGSSISMNDSWISLNLPKSA